MLSYHVAWISIRPSLLKGVGEILSWASKKVSPQAFWLSAIGRVMNNIQPPPSQTQNPCLTHTLGTKQVAKDSAMMECLGSLDELQATMGLLKSFLKEEISFPKIQNQFLPLLDEIQGQLLKFCTLIASSFNPKDIKEKDLFSGQEISFLEKWIQLWNQDLQPVHTFILCGTGKYSALAHLCRTVCRRAERETLRLCRKKTSLKKILPYLNRLSDFFFVLARFLAKTLEK